LPTRKKFFQARNVSKKRLTDGYRKKAGKSHEANPDPAFYRFPARGYGTAGSTVA
jgi:hypothetical protein